MFRQRLRFHCLGSSVIALSVCAALAVPAFADGPSGHDIAERFAADAERTEKRRAERAEQQRLNKLEAERQRDETDMLERARREASDRQGELERQRIAREIAEREEVDRRLAAEREMAERRRAEQERADMQRRQAEVERQAADEARRAIAAQAAEERRRADGARERQAEADRVSEALRKAIENRERERQAAQQPSIGWPPVDRAATPPPPAITEPPMGLGVASEPSGQRFAVLMLMEPGNRGIRRHNKTADPVLCTDAGCYVSNGPTATASLMPHRKALGFFRTWGQRAGACQHSLTCVFRGIETAGLPIHLQPVDMRVMRHDRREAQVVDGGSDCFLAAGRLGCRRPVRGANYVMWLVPEKMAEAIGPALLEQALAEGLPENEQADLGPRRW